MDPMDLIHQCKIKRYFRATRKLTKANLVSHITQRAAGKEPLFIEDSDYLFMLFLLKEISKAYELEVFGFCLMPNHVHFLVRPGADNLSNAMRDLYARYAKKFNKKYERKGHLFGGPYRQAVCLDDCYLVAASLYIHLNPVKANLVQDPPAYRWSSCRLYCDSGSPRSFVSTDFVLRLLAAKTGEAKKIYGNILSRSLPVETGNILEREDTIERFRDKLYSLFPQVFKKAKQGRAVAKASGIEMMSWQALEQQIEGLKSAGWRGRPADRKAKKFLIEQLIARGFKRVEIAARLGVSPKTVYNTLKVEA